MKAILTKEAGDADQLYIGEVLDPVAEAGQVLLHVSATALNRADILQREGKYPPPEGASHILGLEVAGTVIDVGEGVDGFEIGDNMCALVDGGGYAQMIAVDVDRLLRLPESLSFTKAAAIPEVFLTAFQALHWIAGLKQGETLLIHAGASGVGTAAIQLARRMGARVIATASARKHDVIKDLGAEHCIDYRKEDFAEEVIKITDGKGADVIVDFIGAPYFHKNLTAAAIDARIISLAFLGGSKVDNVSLATLQRKRIQYTGSTLRSRSKEYKSRLIADFRTTIWPSFADRRLFPIVDDVFDWERVQEAHRYMESNANIGKIVMTIGS